MTSFFCHSILTHFSPKVVSFPSVSLWHLSFWTLVSDVGHYVYVQQLQQMSLWSIQNQALGQTQPYQTPIHISSGKSLMFPFIALEKFLRTGCLLCCNSSVGPCFPFSASCLLPSLRSTINRKLMPSLYTATSFAQSCQAWIHAVAAIPVAQGKGKNSTWYL